MDKPDIKVLFDIWQDRAESVDIILVDDVQDGTWRWGTKHRAVFRRSSDDTLWAVDYRMQSGDDNHCDFAEQEAERCEAFTVTKTQYRLIKKPRPAPKARR